MLLDRHAEDVGGPGDGEDIKPPVQEDLQDWGEGNPDNSESLQMRGGR